MNTMTATASRPAGLLRRNPWLGAFAFEVTKFVGVRSSWLLLLCALVTTGVGSWLIGASALASGLNGFDTAAPAPLIAAQTMLVSQYAIVIIAALAICSEYSTGSIVTTLQSVPVRSRLLSAKAVMIAMVSAVSGVLLMAVGTPIAAMSAKQFGRFTTSDFVNAYSGVALGMALLALMVTGLGAMLRNAAATIVLTLAILQVLPSVFPLFDNEMMTDAAIYFPDTALTVLVTHPSEPYTWGVAALVLIGWALAGLVGGYSLLRFRDV